MKHWNKKGYAALVLLAALLGISPARLRADTATSQKTGSAAKPKSRAPSTHHARKTSARTSQHRSTHHAQKVPTSTSQHRSTHHAQKVPTSTSQHRSTHRTATRRVLTRAQRAAADRRRRAQMRPQPGRIQEIQQALIQAGYFKEEPSGHWDDQTRDAMRRYQADHGFPVTGLPEAKSLMKLGLGPHPLPAELDTSSAGKAGGDAVSNTPTPSSTQPNPP